MTANGAPSTGEKQRSENRGYSYFNLEKMNVTYTLTSVAGPKQLAPAKFGGISSVPQLQTLESQSVSVWEWLRFGHIFPAVADYFGTAETRYGFSRTRQAAKNGYDPYNVNITENLFQTETGILTKRFAFIPFRLLLSERLLTPLRAPLLRYSAPAFGTPAVQAPTNCEVKSLDIAPPITASSTGNVLCTVPRSLLQETKIGLRVENIDSWLQAGWESGHNFHSPLGYILNRNSPSELDCPAVTNQSVTGCITAAGGPNVTAHSPLSVVDHTLPVSGWFMNFKVVFPIYGKTVQFALENYSELFRKHSEDTSADTRFYQDIIVSLPVKFWQNFSLTPQVEIFNYQSKVLPEHFLSLTSKVTLDYTFDWHAGLKWGKALKYPDPNTITKNAAVPVP